LEHELHNNKSTNSNSNDSSYNLLHMDQEKLEWHTNTTLKTQLRRDKQIKI
jgi:hypothetical protein